MNTDSYTVALANDVLVPMDASQIRAAYDARTLTRRTPIWREGMEVWETIEELAEELRLSLRNTTPPGVMPAHAPLSASAKVVLINEKYRREAADNKSRMWVYASILLAAAALFAGVSWRYNLPENREARDSFDREIKLKRQVERQVLSHLKAPMRAEVTITYCASGPENSVNFEGFVDAENSFGAMLRTPWRATYDGTDQLATFKIN